MRQLFVIILPLTFTLLLVAQGTPTTQPRPVGNQPSQRPVDPQFQRNRNEKTPLEIEFERKRLKALNEERHQSLKKDTDELMKLATELKEHVDKSSENMLSVDVIEKAEEIEKLAKKVRNKMKGYY